jgi:SAM-dependent methyltransferase
VSRVEAIAQAMATGVDQPAMQLVQTGFRVAIADAWDIRPGSSVLEVGCGQGDMTAVLADAVGATGQVVGVDIAQPSYGAPVTLGESAAFLASTPLGARVDIRFGFDPLDERNGFADGTFDDVVLSHCSWYFASVEQLRATLARIAPWARRLCFSEWNLRPDTVDQLPHLLAVLVQGQIEAAGVRGSGNIRTPFSRETMARVLESAGWRLTSEHDLHEPAMRDADWEVDACLRMVAKAERFDELPDAVRDFVTSQADVLRSIARDRGNIPLPSYALTAERA